MIENSLFSISVFLAGVLSFFSPCILPLMPVYVGILLDSEHEKTVRIFGRDVSWYGLVKLNNIDFVSFQFSYIVLAILTEK